MPKPILKWVGGKTQIIEKVISHFPENINSYHEPFVGGGSVLLKFLEHIDSGKIKINPSIAMSKNIYAYDANKWLIMLYSNIKDDVERLIRECNIIQTEYDSCQEINGNRIPTCIQEAYLSKESYYYWTRSLFNTERLKETTNTYKTSARLIFLNKMGFRGLYREGPRGYNVPFGNYKKPRMIDEDNVRCISRLFNKYNVIFEHKDFRTSVEHLVEGDFIYCDPPYVPEKASSFVKYVGGGFGSKDHQELFRILRGFHTKGIRFLLSNSCSKLVREAFPEREGFVVNEIDARRAIHSRDPASRTLELLIEG